MIVRNGLRDLGAYFVALVIPPHNMFGKEEDSLQNVLNLVVRKAPKKDFFKFYDNSMILRFKAKLNTDIEEYFERRFIISYFL